MIMMMIIKQQRLTSSSSSFFCHVFFDRMNEWKWCCCRCLLYIFFVGWKLWLSFTDWLAEWMKMKMKMKILYFFQVFFSLYRRLFSSTLECYHFFLFMMIWVTCPNLCFSICLCLCLHNLCNTSLILVVRFCFFFSSGFFQVSNDVRMNENLLFSFYLVVIIVLFHTNSFLFGLIIMIINAENLSEFFFRNKKKISRWW